MRPRRCRLSHSLWAFTNNWFEAKEREQKVFSAFNEHWLSDVSWLRVRLNLCDNEHWLLWGGYLVEFNIYLALLSLTGNLVYDVVNLAFGLGWERAKYGFMVKPIANFLQKNFDFLLRKKASHFNSLVRFSFSILLLIFCIVHAMGPLNILTIWQTSCQFKAGRLLCTWQILETLIMHLMGLFSTWEKHSDISKHRLRIDAAVR